jgi:hypothetical protein
MTISVRVRINQKKPDLSGRINGCSDGGSTHGSVKIGMSVVARTGSGVRQRSWRERRRGGGNADIWLTCGSGWAYYLHRGGQGKTSNVDLPPKFHNFWGQFGWEQTHTKQVVHLGKLLGLVFFRFLKPTYGSILGCCWYPCGIPSKSCVILPILTAWLPRFGACMRWRSIN